MAQWTSPAFPWCDAVRWWIRLLCYRYEKDSETKYDLLFRFLVTVMEYICKKRRNMDRAAFCNWLRIVRSSTASAWARPEFTNYDDQLYTAYASWSRDMPSRHTFQSHFTRYTLAKKQVHNLFFGVLQFSSIGLFPPLTKVGDIVCVVKGFTLPVFLRRYKDGYQLVGACRIPNLMNGGAEAFLQEGHPRQAKIQEIKLY